MKAGPRVVKCRVCGAPIVWALTRYAVPRPFDATPERRYVLTGEGRSRQARAVEVHRDHFATCPGRKDAA